MTLPRPGDRQIVGSDPAFLALHRKVESSPFEQGQFDSLVLMPTETPILWFVGIPVADGLEAGQGGSR